MIPLLSYDRRGISIYILYYKVIEYEDRGCKTSVSEDIHNR